MSIWSGAQDALVNFLADRELKQRQAMLDEITMRDRDRTIGREDARDARAEREEAAKVAERAAAAAKEQAERDRLAAVQGLTGQRQASLNLAGSGDPTGAQATRDAIAVALRVAGAGEVADKGAAADVATRQASEKQAALDAYDADPSDANARTLEVRYGVKIPKAERDPLAEYEAKKKIDAKYEKPKGPSEAAQILAETRRLALEEKQGKITEAATEKAAKADEARALTQDTLAGVRGLMTHPGLSKAQGIVSSRVTAPFSQDAADFNGERERIVAALTLPNLGALKGPMSDKDVAFIKSISSKLANPDLSETAFKNELKRVETFLESRLGGRRGGDDLGKDW